MIQTGLPYEWWMVPVAIAIALGLKIFYAEHKDSNRDEH